MIRLAKDKMEEIEYRLFFSLQMLFIVASMQANATPNERNISPFFLEDSSIVTITQSSTYVMAGEDMHITVIPNCKFPYRINQILIGGVNIKRDENGVAALTIYGGSAGLHEIPIEVSFIGENDRYESKKYRVRYQVGQTNVCIAVENMNTLYTGINNTVWISTAGMPDEEVSVELHGGRGKIKKIAPDQYSVVVNEVTDSCEIHVYSGGKIRAVSQFKVRMLPTPTCNIGGYSTGDTLTAGAFKAQAGVSAYVKDFFFEKEYYKIVSYTMTLLNENETMKKAECKGAPFSSAAKSQIAFAKAGSVVIISNIVVKDEGGRVARVAPLVYYIK